MDASAAEFTYVAYNFKEALVKGSKMKRIESTPFKVLGFSWSVLLFPTGSMTRKQSKSTSVFLRLENVKEVRANEMPTVNFELEMINRSDPLLSVSKKSTHTFSEHEEDWGFAEFLLVDKLKFASQQFMPDGHLHVRVKLSMSGPATKGVHAPAQKPADDARVRQAPAASGGAASTVASSAAVKAAKVARDVAKQELAIKKARFDVAAARAAVLEAEARAAVLEAEAELKTTQTALTTAMAAADSIAH